MTGDEMQTLVRLRELIAEFCAVPPDLIVENARLRGYGIDSVRMLDLMLSIEEEFGIQFKIEELESVRTVGDLAVYVERLRREYRKESSCESQR